MATQDDSWSISVKTVGGSEASDNAGSGERKFTVTVSPNDDLACLYNQIEGVTGLKASQQRLIYRGRLIASGGTDDSEQQLEVEEPKIKDIAGLCDGQTIHLVRKRDNQVAEDGASTPAGRNNGDNPARENSSEENNGSMPSGAQGSLLAALLGLGSLDDESSNGRADGNNGGPIATRVRGGWRSSRLSRGRRPHYRLTAEDLELPDPGSMESVRQGLMTLHTMLPHARGYSTPTEESVSPLAANRQWYRGQWIDCRDTVNQWLEATVVDIVLPHDILPPRTDQASHSQSQRRRSLQPANDPAVGANDFEGRRRLLLESCDSDDSDAEEGELAGFRRRDNNAGVQILLIHYNGWPHRWDEWIRSDSERIRPFRTRTRHPSMASHSSPTPQSAFSEAPSTHIRNSDETSDRTALLPELCRVVSDVHDLLQAVNANTADVPNTDNTPTAREQLPWTVQDTSSTENELDDLPPLVADPLAADEAPVVANGHGQGQPDSCSENRRIQTQQQLAMVAPLLDRLGRTLTDAAPHVAALARSLRDGGAPGSSEDPEQPSTSTDDMPSPLGGLLSLLTRDRRRQAEQDAASNSPSRQPDDPTQESSDVDPDHMDFSVGMVNTYRGEVRSGPRDRSQQDDVANLLGAYLAAASLSGLANSDDTDNNDDNGNTMQGLGRLLRDRGTNGGGGGGGIDIHIHAIVTTPGGGTGGLGVAALGGGGPGNALGNRTLFSAGREPRSGPLLRSRIPSVQHAQDDDDLGLFSELYSENPTPVNPNGSTPTRPHAGIERENDAVNNPAANSDFLARLSPARSRSGISRTDALTVTPSRGHRHTEGNMRDRSGSPSSRRGNAFSRLFRRSRR